MKYSVLVQKEIDGGQNSYTNSELHNFEKVWKIEEFIKSLLNETEYNENDTFYDVLGEENMNVSIFDTTSKHPILELNPTDNFSSFIEQIYKTNYISYESMTNEIVFSDDGKYVVGLSLQDIDFLIESHEEDFEYENENLCLINEDGMFRAFYKDEPIISVLFSKEKLKNYIPTILEERELMLETV